MIGGEMSHPGGVMTPEVRKFIDLSMSLKEIIGISADMESGVAFERIRIYLNKRFPQLGLKPSDPIGKAIPWLEQAVLDFNAHPVYGTKPDKPEPEKPKTGPFGMPAREENEDDPELKALLDNINKEEKAKKPVVQQGVKPKRKTAMQEIVEEEDAKCFASMEKDCLARAAAEEKKDRRWKYTGEGVCISCKRSMYLDLEKKVCLSCFTKYRDLGKEISLAINTQKLKCLEKRISENPNGGCLYVDIVDYHTLTGCPVAQLARACGSEPQGSPSESGQDNQKKLTPEQEKAIAKVANGIKKAIKDESWVSLL